jgi:hypothetical protein
VPQIDIPRFGFGDKQQGGVGQGDGEPGDPVDGGEEGGRRRQGQGRQGEGEHALEVEVTLDELAQILGEELQLPRIEPKGKSQVVDEKDKLHRHPPRRARSRCGTSSARTAGAQAPDLLGDVQPEEPDHRADPRGQALPRVEDPPSPSPTRSSST